MNVTKITIGRLYNLGSYEHVRYELTAEIPAGESPATALIGLERILEGLNPKPLQSADSHEEIERKRKRLAEEEALTDEAFARQHGHTGVSYVGTRAEYTQRVRDGIDESERKTILLETRAATARKLLEDLGGAANWKDAKLDWDSDY